MPNVLQIKLPEGHRQMHFAEISSTNSEGLERADNGEHGPLWIVADRQTQGRGRLGRTWVSLEGNLHASLVMTPDCPPGRSPELGFVAGLACYDAAVTCLGKDLEFALKWPNDLLYDGKKIAGLLLEIAGKRGNQVVIGFGVNIAGHPSHVKFPANHLAAIKPGIEKAAFLMELAQAMDHWLAIWDRGGGFEAIRTIWCQRAYKLGEKIEIDLGKTRMSGIFTGLDANGGLILELNNGAQEIILAGDMLRMDRE